MSLLVRFLDRDFNTTLTLAGITASVEIGSEEVIRDLGEDSGAVAHQRVCSSGSTVIQIAEGIQRVNDDVVPRAAPHGGHQGHTARIMLVLTAVEPDVVGLGGEAGDGHVGSPSSWSAGRGPGRSREGADGNGHVWPMLAEGLLVLRSEPGHLTM